MDSVDGNAQAGGLAHDDLGAGPVEPQHIAVDDLAGDDKACQSGRFVDGHLGDGGLEGRLHLAGELYLHRAGQGLAVVAQQLLPFLGRTEADVPPRKARDDLARAAVQRQLRVRVQICLQVGGVQREDVVCPGVEPPAGRAADEVTRLRGGDLGRLSQLGLAPAPTAR